MKLLAEDSEARASFDHFTGAVHGGRPLRQVAATLAIWSKLNPAHGGLAREQAIMSNEVTKADELLTDVAAERAACAELMRAAGCVCFDLEPAECRASFEALGGDPEGAVAMHDHRCPIALAASIESRGI